MRKQILFVIAFVVMATLCSFAQQALWGAPGIVLPEVKENKNVRNFASIYENGKPKQKRTTGMESIFYNQR